MAQYRITVETDFVADLIIDADSEEAAFDLLDDDFNKIKETNDIAGLRKMMTSDFKITWIQPMTAVETSGAAPARKKAPTKTKVEAPTVEKRVGRNRGSNDDESEKGTETAKTPKSSPKKATPKSSPSKAKAPAKQDAADEAEAPKPKPQAAPKPKQPKKAQPSEVKEPAESARKGRSRG